MSPELKEYTKIAIIIYKDILNIESVEIYKEYVKIIYPSPQEAFRGDPQELKDFLDKLIS